MAGFGKRREGEEAGRRLECLDRGSGDLERSLSRASTAVPSETFAQGSS